MNDILVSGLINIETTLQIDGFPIPYFPVRYPFFGVHSAVSGVGYNVAKALSVLGRRPHLVSLVGRDLAGELVDATLEKDGLDKAFVRRDIEHTAQSVILYEPTGRRQINVDLKDVQTQTYPQRTFEQALAPCQAAVLCNINFSRPFLPIARQQGMTIATDVHAIATLDDDYNQDFMRSADILFMSDEHLPCPPEECAQRVLERYHNEIVVIGLGDQGALLAVRRDSTIGRIPAVYTRPVINTIGAGDALFSAFVHFYIGNSNPYQAIRKAVIFASYKVGAAGAAEGFLDEAQLDIWNKRLLDLQLY